MLISVNKHAQFRSCYLCGKKEAVYKWLLALLKRDSLGWLKGAVYKRLFEWLKRSSLGLL